MPPGTPTSVWMPVSATTPPTTCAGQGARAGRHSEHEECAAVGPRAQGCVEGVIAGELGWREVQVWPWLYRWGTRPQHRPRNRHGGHDDDVAQQDKRPHDE